VTARKRIVHGKGTPIGQLPEAGALACLHACRAADELDAALAALLQRTLPAASLCLCLLEDETGFRVRLVQGACPWQLREIVDPHGWGAARTHLDLRYRDHQLGVLVVAAVLDAAQRRAVEAIIEHYGVSLVNITLNEESRRATDHYCANLQVLEEGIVLFQEGEREVVMARLMGLATTMLHAQAGALYVLREIGDVDSQLDLAQTLGIPEAMLASFAGPQSAAWLRSFLQDNPVFIERATDPTLRGLQAADLPAIVHNLVALPFCYHGVAAGVCLLFNADKDSVSMQDQLERMASLGQLGAALLHRFGLEAEALRTRTLEHELQIAATIQNQLLPSRAPQVPGFDFAWRSVAAQSIGGDCLDLLGDDAGNVHALIADASGHGINSALLMSSFRSNYRAQTGRMSPELLLSTLNDEVCGEVEGTGMFITAAALRLDPQQRHLHASSAGHNPLLLLRGAAGTVEQIESHGPPLGFLRGAGFGSQRYDLAPGDIVLLYTDGITEATGRDQEMFGVERLEACLRRNASLAAGDILAATLTELEQFTGRDRQEDDVSLTVVKTL
jgi:serine phosphatase RsbU (regulator of sigma subunit)